MRRLECRALVFPSFVTRDEDWATALLMRDAAFQRFNRLARIQFLRLAGPLFDAVLDLAEITWRRGWDERDAHATYHRNDGTDFWPTNGEPMIRAIESVLHEPGVNMFAWCDGPVFRLNWQDKALEPYSARCKAALAAKQLKIRAHPNRVAP